MVWTLLIVVLFCGFLVERMLYVNDKYEKQLIRAYEIEIRLINCNANVTRMRDTVIELKQAKSELEEKLMKLMEEKSRLASDYSALREQHKVATQD